MIREQSESSRVFIPRKRGAPSAEARSCASLWQAVPGLVLPGPVLPSGLAVRVISLRRPNLAGRSLLFFSDTHIRSGGIRGFFPHLRQGGGIDWLSQAFLELFQSIPEPDWILFGGDLAGEAAWLGKAQDLLRSLPSAPHKFAVCGNWELRRRWIPSASWRSIFADAGFQLLQNESAFAESLPVIGLDDAKEGDPSLPASFNPAVFSCIVTHNPDPAASILSSSDLAAAPLILAGHTHGGQFRLPFCGALLTSSKFGKKFEYGAYRHKETGAVLYVSAGIGATWFNARICCPPEILLVNFQ